MNVRVPTELEAFVRKRVATGEYRDEADVVAHALRLLDERLVALHAALDEGEADLAAGRSTVVRTQEELDQLFLDP